MFDLTRLRISGFRGFVGERELRFDAPVVILFGDNHRGKSSALNAVEWCLFGDECLGKKTGIRERLDWEVLNRQAKDGKVSVEAEFSSTEGTHVVVREMTGARKRGGTTVAVTIPDGTVLHGDDAERRLTELFHSSFRDFMTTVYQHQEAIRAILTDEPRDRNDAIDRLLGLSDYRELAAGFRAAAADRWRREIDGDFEQFRLRAQQSIHVLDNLIEEEKQKAIAGGIREEDLTEEEAVRLAGQVGEAIRSLAHDLGMTDFEVAVPQTHDEVEEFRERAKDQADEVWAQAPDVAKQAELAKEQQSLASVKGSYEAAMASEKQTRQELEAFVREHGDDSALARQISEMEERASRLDAQMREANRRANVVREGIEYLRGVSAPSEAKKCPLCFNEVPDLLAHLQSEWEGRIRKDVEELEEARKQCASSRTSLESRRGELAELERKAGDARTAAGDYVTEAGTALGRQITKDDDPGALLDKRLDEIALGIDRIRKAIDEKAPKRQAIFSQLARLRTIAEIIGHARKRALVERIWKTQEFSALDAIRDEAARFVEDVKAVRECLAVTSREEAQEKVAAAGAALDENFRRLTNHPAVRGLMMEVDEDTRSGLNTYAFRSKDGTDSTPILSQGDLNCLALSLFLGLARATAETQPFRFLMLDDPAQSLGSEAKTSLVAVLEDVTEWRKLIVSTADDDVKELLLSNLTKNKVMYDFLDWTEADGPNIVRAP